MKTSIKSIRDYGNVGLRVELTITDELLISQLVESIKNAPKTIKEMPNSNVAITQEMQTRLINFLSKLTTVKMEESPLFADGDTLPEKNGTDNDINKIR